MFYKRLFVPKSKNNRTTFETLEASLVSHLRDNSIFILFLKIIFLLLVVFLEIFLPRFNEIFF